MLGITNMNFGHDHNTCFYCQQLSSAEVTSWMKSGSCDVMVNAQNMTNRTPMVLSYIHGD